MLMSPPREFEPFVPKHQITLRLDAAIVEYYRATGPRWQSRINTDLADVVKFRQAMQPARRRGPR